MTEEKSTKVNESQIDFLKPCPFCGADPINLSIENDEYGDYYIYCNVCDAYYENANAGLDNLINGWNRRAHDPIEELRKSAPIHLTYEQMKRYYYGHVRPFSIDTEKKE